MNKSLFIENMISASAEVDKEYCNRVVKESLKKIPDELNSDGTMNLVIVMEELAELSQEVSKALRGEGSKFCLIEEMADVCLGIKYLQEIFDIKEEDLAKACNVKLNRQNLRNDFTDKEDVSEDSIFL